MYSTDERLVQGRILRADPNPARADFLLDHVTQNVFQQHASGMPYDAHAAIGGTPTASREWDVLTAFGQELYASLSNPDVCMTVTRAMRREPPRTVNHEACYMLAGGIAGGTIGALLGGAEGAVIGGYLVGLGTVCGRIGMHLQQHARQLHQGTEWRRLRHEAKRAL